jgi:SAM-dependent methyltransferase
VEQERIWEHFQTRQVESFDHARGRYRAMASEARRRFGRDGGSVLNIGVGPGVLERLLLSRGWRVSALDPSAATIERLAALPIDARCEYGQAMTFADASFDVVVGSEVLEHIVPDVRALVLAEVSRVLVPGGWFVGSVPYRETLVDQQVVCPDCSKVFHRWGHVSSYDTPELQQELGRIFVEVSCRRRSLVDWGSVRSPMQLVRATAQYVLGRMGETIANPSIVFAARRARDA